VNLMNSTSSATLRGRLKIYLGYSAGVGKTFQMLSNAHDARRQGIDVAVGYYEAHKRQDTLALLEGLEVIPRRQIAYRGRSFEEMDTDAILQRKPQLCLVDEFAHTNVPGAERAKRWEDVLVLLDAGINVWTTLNVQHIESLNDAVLEITKIPVRETVPDWVIKQAAEIQLVDVTPEALLNRLRRGAVYTGDLAKTAVDKFFRESNLRALRELALREAAHEIQVRQEEYDLAASPETDAQAADAGAGRESSASQENILLLVTSDPTTAMLIRRARRVADYLHAGCLALYIHRQENFHEVPEAERDAVERHLNFARNLRIETRTLPGEDVAETLLEFARRNGVTQIFLSRALLQSRASFARRDLVRQIIRRALDLQITVVAARHGNGAEAADHPQD
jgi:two-component system, OmpR family, sensor histidine kinase KdpD